MSLMASAKGWFVPFRCGDIEKSQRIVGLVSSPRSGPGRGQFSVFRLCDKHPVWLTAQRGITGLGVLGLLSLMVGCSWLSLPSVSDSVIDRVPGENVRIVAEESDTNPTEEWIYTYLLLEVDAPERHLDVVAETLTRNGWQTRESAAPNIQLVALIPAEADLTLITLDSFLKPIASSPVAAKFADVQRDVDKAYFVAIIMPLEER